MSTNKSENLGLHLWVPSDDVSRAEFNENFETLDQTAHALDGSLNALEGTVNALGGTVSGLGSSVNTMGNTVNTLNSAVNALNALKPVGRTEYDADKTAAAGELNRKAAELSASIDQKVQALNTSVSNAAGANRLVFLAEGTSVTLPSLTPYRMLLAVGSGPGTLYFNGDQSSANYSAYAGGSDAGLIFSGNCGVAFIFPDGNNISGFAIQMSGGVYTRLATYTGCGWSGLRSLQNRLIGTFAVYGLK